MEYKNEIVILSCVFNDYIFVLDTIINLFTVFIWESVIGYPFKIMALAIRTNGFEMNVKSEFEVPSCSTVPLKYLSLKPSSLMFSTTTFPLTSPTLPQILWHLSHIILWPVLKIETDRLSDKPGQELGKMNKG